MSGTAAMEPGLRGREDPRIGMSDWVTGRPLWSPAFGAGKTVQRTRGDAAELVAAMEPGLRGREDPTSGATAATSCPPLWSPAFGAGTTGSTEAGAGECGRPLWSPAFGAGKTGGPSAVPDPGHAAAMEPGLRGREDDGAEVAWLSVWTAPLWSPAFGAGKTGSGWRTPGRVRPGRYGARPSGPGRRRRRQEAVPQLRHAAMEPGLRGREDSSVSSASSAAAASPLWSPAFGAGKTATSARGAPDATRAAMEPGLRGREDAGVARRTGRRAARRYGARPSGPGRQVRCVVDGEDPQAAMEPGLRGREDPGRRPAG